MGMKEELHNREAREEELSRRRKEGRQILEELRLAQRNHSLSEMVRVAHCRGGSKRARAHLSMHAGHAFPAAKKRVQALRKQRKGAGVHTPWSTLSSRRLPLGAPLGKTSGRRRPAWS